MTRRVVLFGGSGFLGSHILRRLTGTPGIEVATAGRRPSATGHPHVLVDLATTTSGDLTRVLADHAPDVVVNAAGMTGGHADDLWATNVAGTLTLLDALRRTGGPVRLVHLGSAAEYGAVPAGRPVSEDAAPNPTSDYGATKLAATELVTAARRLGLDAVVLRVFNPLGPGAPASTLAGRVVSELQRVAGTGAEIRLGPLGDHRDFVDVRDVAGAALAAVMAPSLEQPVLNIGSGRAVPIRAIVDELVAIAGFNGRIREARPAGARSGQVPWQQADVAAAARCLGWRPSVALATSLRDLWQEHAICDAGRDRRLPQGNGAGEVPWTTTNCTTEISDGDRTPLSPAASS